MSEEGAGKRKISMWEHHCNHRAFLILPSEDLCPLCSVCPGFLFFSVSEVVHQEQACLLLGT